MAGLLAGPVFGSEDDGDILNVIGSGAQNRIPYRGGGTVRFLSVGMPISLVHLGEGSQIPAGIDIGYEVLRTAPIYLNSRFGSEYWTLYNYTNEALSRLHSEEKIDLRRRGGPAATRASSLTVDLARGSRLQKGLCAIRGRSYFLIVDPKTDNWVDIVEPNAFWHSSEIKQKLTFTLANLDRYKLRLDEFGSTWKPEGKFRVRLTVTDADGDTFPIPRAEVTAQAVVGGKRLPARPLGTLYDSLQVPLGCFQGTLPAEKVDAVIVSAKVLMGTPRGTVSKTIAWKFPYGNGKVTKLTYRGVFQPPRLRRTASGKIVETRAFWVHAKDFATPEATQAMIARVKEANFNVIIPIVYVRGCVMFKTSKLPMEGGVQEGFDPLAYLVDRAHRAGLEVHPWFCNAYFGAKQGGSYGPGFARYPQFAVVGKNGSRFATVNSSVPADLHNPEYQKFMADIMVDVARRYPIDGLHFDYIRTMTDCYCGSCRRDFAKRFGHGIETATEEEWVKWHREAAGRMVREISARAKKVRRGIILSAAVFANLESAARQGQDAPRWADAGDLDVILPMDYTMDTFEMRRNERSFLDAMKRDSRLATGVSIYVRSTGKVTSRDPSLVLEQIAMIRSMGIQGFCLFAYDHLTEGILSALRSGPCSRPAVPAFRVR
jgi:uncharacterized lipoprotein YddW (UPF0748 family)